jgi:hypothetical protein
MIVAKQISCFAYSAVLSLNFSVLGLDSGKCAFHWFYMQAKDTVVLLYSCFSLHSQNTMEESSRPGEKASLLQKLLSE